MQAVRFHFTEDKSHAFLGDSAPVPAAAPSRAQQSGQESKSSASSAGLPAEMEQLLQKLAGTHGEEV